MSHLTVLSALVIVLSLVASARLAAEAHGPAAECRSLLDRTFAALIDRPALKEEFATAIMWMRLDALNALEAGHVETCLEQARRAAALLKVD